MISIDSVEVEFSSVEVALPDCSAAISASIASRSISTESCDI